MNQLHKGLRSKLVQDIFAAQNPITASLLSSLPAESLKMVPALAFKKWNTLHLILSYRHAGKKARFLKQQMNFLYELPIS